MHDIIAFGQAHARSVEKNCAGKGRMIGFITFRYGCRYVKTPAGSFPVSGVLIQLLSGFDYDRFSAFLFLSSAAGDGRN
jgi:hypothetical protein